MKVLKQVAGLLMVISLSITTVCAAEVSGSEGLAEMADGYLTSYEAPIPREEFCYLVISLMAELEDSTVDKLYQGLTDKQKNESFADVDGENPYIALAKKYELVVGKDGMRFSPNEPIKRQEAASIILNLVNQVAPEYYDDSTDYTEDISIEDHVEISSWAKDAVEFVLGTGLMKTDQNDNFDPTASMTVEESVMLISSVRVYLNAPLPEEEPEEEGIPTYVWIFAGAGVALLLSVVAALLIHRHNRKKREEKEAREHQLEQALNLRLAPVIPPDLARATTVEKISPRQAAPVPRANLEPQTAASGETVFIGQVQIPQLHIFSVQGSEADRIFDLGTPVTIGRSDDNRLCLPNSTISRKHCQIRWNGQQLMLEDVAARNSISVLRGAETLTVQKGVPQPLNQGDLLILGSLRLKVELR
ncbi:putative surface layer protein [Oscillibacter valericigenes Sjm18-20]|nr:putative surface layer protein [Oscillibacter valericigenes Sjm18-20]